MKKEKTPPRPKFTFRISPASAQALKTIEDAIKNDQVRDADLDRYLPTHKRHQTSISQNDILQVALLHFADTLLYKQQD